MFSKVKYRKDIQVLRGLAVTAVVLFHANENYFPTGYLGVDVFFVISGFVVTPLILRIFINTNREKCFSNLKFFYISRFYRLAPALAVTLVISAIIIFLFGEISEQQRYARQGIAASLLIGNLGAYRYSEDYFSPNPSPLVHTWSLSVEEQIYIILPIIIMIVLFNRKNLKKVTAIVFILITIISFISFLSPKILQPLYSLTGIQMVSQFSFYSPFDRIWQFTLGGLGFLISNRFTKHVKAVTKNTNLVFIFIIAVILIGPIEIGTKTFSIIASFIALIIILSKSLDTLPNFLSNKLEWLGDRSYSIYLVHLPLIYIAKYSPMTLTLNGNKAYQTLLTVVAIAASIFFGSLSFVSIENKFRLGKDRVNGTKNIAIAVILTVLGPLVFFAAIDIGSRNGYWGLIGDRYKQPISAHNYDPNCARLSDFLGPCEYKQASAKRTILLIGDSQAAALSEAVYAVARNQNWNLVAWTHGGCPIQFDQEPFSKVSETCIQMNKQMLDWVLSNKPELIVISQLTRNFHSQDQLKSALVKLHSITPNIVHVENIPIFPNKAYFARERSIVMFDVPNTKIPINQMDKTNLQASDALAKWASSYGIHTLKFNHLFCNKETCNMQAEKRWLYTDYQHLSIFGAELTIPQLEPFFKNF